MKSTDMRRRRCSAAIRSRICFCTVTSSALVGSSAISSFGSQAIAIAIITRCCSPPESREGTAASLASGEDRPTSSKRLSVLARASLPESPRCWRSTSATWKPTLNTGFRELIGSWKIIEISAPRSARSSRAGVCSRSLPLKIIRPRALAFPGNKPRMESAVTDLPLPDSPTSATVLCSGISKLTPFTAGTVPKFTRRSRTLSRLIAASDRGRRAPRR